MAGKEENFSEWYNEIIRSSDLIDDRYNVKGFYVRKPWMILATDEIYKMYDKALQKRKHLPVLFPSVIPEKNFFKEAEHIEGFAPEVFWVNATGSDKEPLEEPLALAPTSETAFYQLYHYWVRSYRDLPLKYYQKRTVFRHETKATKPLMREREFLWIETHCVFDSKEKAWNQVLEDMEISDEIIHGELGVPYVFFRRPQWDKFPGALDTYALDTLMPDGKVNQIGSTHMLGQGFAKVFDIKFKDESEQELYAWQTCYGPGFSRIIAAVIATHGDDKGLVWPFSVAPMQIVIVPILIKGSEEKVLKECRKLEEKISGKYRVVLDESLDETPGAKYFKWEMKGVPLRIEVGPKDLAAKEYTVFRRDTGKREKVKAKDLDSFLEGVGEKILANLKKKADAIQASVFSEAKSLDKLIEEVEKGRIVRVGFCSMDMAGSECAGTIRDKTKGHVRGTIVGKNEVPKQGEKCVVCGKKAIEIVYVARAY